MHALIMASGLRLHERRCRIEFLDNFTFSPAACANLLRAVEVHYYAQLTILDVANISGRYLSGAVPCRKAREYLLKGNSAETSPIAMI